jgi:PAS domain S-box-containing protein
MVSNIGSDSLNEPGANQEQQPVPGWALRRRLPLLIFSLLAILGIAFSWMAYYEVKRGLLASGSERISAAGRQVVDLLGQAAFARLAEAKRLAEAPEVREAAVAHQQGLELESTEIVNIFVLRNPQTSIWLYDPNGEVLGQLAHGDEAPAAPALPTLTEPIDGVSPVRPDAGRVIYQTTATVPAAVSEASPVGHLAIQRPLGSTQAATLIARLIGSDAMLKLGNTSGDTWTARGMPVEAPPPSSPGIPATYRRADGQSRIGIAMPVPNTPWVVWVEVSEESVLGPAATLLKRMLPITIGLTALSALAVYLLGGRVTRPLEEMATAAEAIAAGDFSRRVTPAKGQEVGRLGAAFNVMTEKLADSRSQLEARVQERTKELEFARAELDQFFLLSLDLLCIGGTDGRFRRVNPAWERALGWTDAEIAGVLYLDLVHPDDQQATELEIAKLAEGQTVVNFENRYRSKDGQYRWLQWNAAPFAELGLIYGTAHDVTERKQTELALHQYGAELAAANRELESFSYSVSHDLRAPLRSIDGFAQALAEDYEPRLDDTGRDYLKRIRRAAQRMGMLIDDLLSLSRVTRVELTRTAVDLSAAVKDAAQRVQELEPNRKVEWRILPGVVAEGDSRLLQVAIDNLIGNAWKFTSQQPAAMIEFGVATLEDGHSAFMVRDNGAGFDMAHAGKLFGAFQRLHGITEFPGTGIGLATVHRIVRRHGGRIWAESAVGAGATFYFTLEGQ